MGNRCLLSFDMRSCMKPKYIYIYIFLLMCYNFSHTKCFSKAVCPAGLQRKHGHVGNTSIHASCELTVLTIFIFISAHCVLASLRREVEWTNASPAGVSFSNLKRKKQTYFSWAVNQNDFLNNFLNAAIETLFHFYNICFWWSLCWQALKVQRQNPAVSRPHFFMSCTALHELCVETRGVCICTMRTKVTFWLQDVGLFVF